MQYAHWAILFLAAGPADAAEPTFTVTNKVPPSFTVTNKTAPAKTFTDRERYAYLVKDVEEGVRPVAMIVGPHPSLHEYIHQERFPSGFMGFADGVYDCFRRDSDGTAMMLKREEVKPAATPFPQPATTPFSGRAIPVQSAGKFLMSRSGAVQYAVPTYTLTGFTGGITWTNSCPPSG